MGEQILVVEDEFLIGTAIAGNLKELGYEVGGIVSSGEKAIEFCAAFHPDLVLMDIKLKGELDGIEAAKRIRQYEIPVVFLTSYNDDAILERARLVLPHGYLLKPIRPGDLQTTVKMALYKHQFEKQLKRREGWLNSVLASLWDGVITTDATDKITFINFTAERLTGWMAEEGIGRSYEEVLHLQENGGSLGIQSFIQQSFEDSFQKSQINRDQLTLINKDRQSIPIDIYVTYLKEDQETIVGKVIVLHDRSERQQLTEKIEEQRQLLLNLLTSRQKEVLELIVNGKTTREIATTLFISPRTVEFHRQNIMRQLNVHNLTSLLHVTLAHKLVSFDEHEI